MQLLQVAVRAVVDLVVELREPDLPLEADLRAARVEVSRDLTNAAAVTARPWECPECPLRRVPDIDAKSRGLSLSPRRVN